MLLNKLNLNNYVSEFSLVFFVLSLFYYFACGTTWYTPIIKLMFFIGVFSGLIACLIYLKKLKKSEYYILILCFFFSTVGLINGDTRFFVLSIAMFISNFISLDKIYTLIFYEKLTLLVFTLLFYKWNHPNTLAAEILTVFLIYIYKFIREIKKDNICIMISIIALSYYLTKSETASAIQIIILLFMIICCRNKKIIIPNIVTYIYPIIGFANVFLCSTFNFAMKLPFLSTLYSFLDKVSSARIGLGQYSLDIFGISLFGGNVNYSNLPSYVTYFNLDSGYMWLLQGFGVLIFITFCLINTLIIKNLISEKNYKLILIGIAMAILGFSEDIFMNINYNIFSMCWGYEFNKILNKKKENTNEIDNIYTDI